MYYRHPGYIDLESLKYAIRAMPEPEPMTLAERLLLSVGMIVAPVLAFFLILGVSRLVSVL